MKSNFAIKEENKGPFFLPTGVIFIRNISSYEKKMLKIDFSNRTWEVIHKKNDTKEVYRYKVNDFHISAVQGILNLDRFLYFRSISPTDYIPDSRFPKARTVKNHVFSDADTIFYTYSFVIFYPHKTMNGNIEFATEDPFTMALGYVKEHEKDIYRERI